MPIGVLDIMDEINQDSNLENARDGEVSEATEQPGSHEESSSNTTYAETDPYKIKKRLGQQAKKHEREMAAMREHLGYLQSQIGNNQPENVSSYASIGQPPDAEEARIQHAVRLALHAKDAEEQRAREAESHRHVQRQYQRLEDELDKGASKYDDFDDVVRAHDVPFSPAIREALLIVDNPAEVAYKLGKNRDELQRISRLHPLEQAREVHKLSKGLMNDGIKGPNSMVKPMGQIKSNPASTSAGQITDKTPTSVIRARMKAGTFK